MMIMQVHLTFNFTQQMENITKIEKQRFYKSKRSVVQVYPKVDKNIKSILELTYNIEQQLIFHSSWCCECNHKNDNET